MNYKALSGKDYRSWASFVPMPGYLPAAIFAKGIAAPLQSQVENLVLNGC
jgi:hypothetical protein